MSTKKNKDQSPPLDDDAPVSQETPAQAEGGWKLKYKKCQIKSPTSGKLIDITTEMLDNDPVLLAHMIAKHQDCLVAL